MSELDVLKEELRAVTDRVRVAILVDDDMEDYEDALAEQDAIQDMIREAEEGDECDECRINTSGDPGEIQDDSRPE